MLRKVIAVVMALLLTTAPVGAATVGPDGTTDTEHSVASGGGSDRVQSVSTAPSPEQSIDAPDTVTVGETFSLSVRAENDGGRAGHYSTISISSPSFTDGDRFTDISTDLDYTASESRGDEIYDRDGDRITAEYALVEAGTNGNTYWESGERNRLSVQITPQDTGTLVFYVRTTLTDDADSLQKYTAPSSSHTYDQQGFMVRRIEVDVRSATSASIDDFSVDRGTYQRGDTVRGQTRVINTGDSRHTFYVGYSFRGPGGDMYSNDGTTHEEVTLDPGEVRTVGLSWTVPNGAPSGEYDAVTSVWKDEDGSKLYGRLDSAGESNAVTVEDDTPAAVIDDLDPPTGTYRPGDTVTGTVTVENTGPVAHTFWVDVSGETPGGAWIEGEGTHVSLDPGERRELHLSWQIPADAPRGTYGFGTAVYRSDAKDDRYDNWGDTNAFSVEQAEPTATIWSFSAAEGVYQPGDEVSSTVLVENTGEVRHRFYVGYSFRGPDAGTYSNDDTTHEAVTLDPGERTRVRVEWTVPETAPAGEYDAFTSIWRHESGGELSDRLDSADVSNAITIEEDDPTATIRRLSPPTGTYQPGETVTGTVTVENTGPVAHTFWVDVSGEMPGGAWIEGEGTHVSLDPGERRELHLSWQIPDDASRGTYGFGAGIYRSDAKDDRYDNWGDTDAFTVAQPDPSGEIRSFWPAEGVYQPGDEVSSTVLVENTGEVRHRFYVGYSFRGPGGAVYSNDETTHEPVSIRPGSQQRVEVTWTVPEHAPAGTYDAVAALWTATSNDGLTGKLDVARADDAISIADASVSVPSITVTPERPRPNAEVSVSVQVANDGVRTLDDGTLRVALGEETTTRQVDLEVGETSTFTVDLETGSKTEQDVEVILASEDMEPVEKTRTLSLTTTTTLSGVVVSQDGDPIANAVVHVAGRTAETGTDGRFSITDLSPGRHGVTIETQHTTLQRTLELTAGEELSKTFQIGADGALSIAEAPSSYQVGERVDVSLAVQNTGESESTYSVVAPDQAWLTLLDTDRVRSVTVPAGEQRRLTYTFRIEDEAPERSLPFQLRGPGDSRLDDATATLKQSETTLEVKVVDANGHPVDDAIVGPLSGRDYRTDESGVATIDLSTPSEDSLGYDGDGNWKLYLDYKATEYGAQDIRDVYISEGRTNQVVIHLPARAEVSGTVSVDGDALGDVEVLIGDETVRTTAQGQFRLSEPISPGSYYIRVMKNDRVILRQVVNVNKGYNTFSLSVPEVRYEAATGTDEYVQGIVQDVFDDDADEIQGDIYGDVVEDESVDIDGDLGGQPFFMTDGGQYYTTGPCAWHSSEDRCEAAGIKPDGDEESAKGLSRGMLSGFIYGGEETINGFKQLLKPIEYLGELYDLAVSILRDAGLLEDLLAAIPQQLKEQQRDDNPYPRDSTEYENFASGWYGGYGSYILVSTVATGGVGSSASKAFSTSSKFTKVADKAKDLSEAAKSQRFSRYADEIGDGDGDAGDLNRPSSSAFDDLDPETKSRLSSLDADTRDRIQDLRQRDVVDEDGLARLGRLVDPDAKYIAGENVDADDLLDLAEEGVDLAKTQVVVRDTNGNIVRLMDGNVEDAGWQHIEARHIEGSYQLDQKGATTFFPTGKTIRGHDLPQTMSDADVRRLVAEAIQEHPNPTKPPTVKYRYELPEEQADRYGIDEIEVQVDSSGEVRSAFPRGGSAVHKYRPQADTVWKEGNE